LKKKGFKSSRSAPTAIKRVKSYLTKHMKVEEDNIWIDDSLNNSIWKKGKYNMESKIRVKAVKFEDGVVEVYLPELEFKKSRRELLKEEREKKEPILKKEEEITEGEGDEVSGAEDYDISPTADGEVKIKKKKTPKEKDKDIKKKTSEKKAKPKKILTDEEKLKKKEEKKTNEKSIDKTKKAKKPNVKTKAKQSPTKLKKNDDTKSKKVKSVNKEDKNKSE
jgi:large subunit ribosomal protein L31e